MTLAKGFSRTALAGAVAVLVSACGVGVEEIYLGEADLPSDEWGEISEALTAAKAGSVIQTTANVYLRSGPSTSHTALLLISKGSYATVSDPKPQNGYFKIRYGTKEGYSYGAYWQAVTVMQATAEVNVRTGAGTGYTSLGTAKKGETAYLVKRLSTGWLQLHWKGTVAYSHGSYWTEKGYVPPDSVACEYSFFSRYFDRDNPAGYKPLGDAAFQHVVKRHKSLQACGAKVTLGGMLSLMIFEGGGAKVAFYNDLCAENSYNKSSTCWQTPKARYSYQYGLAPYHMSNFHPCADAYWTGKMRSRLSSALSRHGFVPTSTQIASVTSQLRTFCPNSTPTAVDYYILTAHSAFGVPVNSTGNNLANAGKYPFFKPEVVVDLFFDAFAEACTTLTGDRAAIAWFGGGDTSYKTTTKQNAILKLWNDHSAAYCN